ncbi:MAG: HIT family protein [Roseburia sp.]
MRQDDCIFCKIAAGEIPSNTIYEDELFKVILDLNPASKGHALVIPKDHYANLFELDEQVAGKAIQVAKKVGEKMKTVLKADGLNLLQNNGEVAGQTVFHFHMHIIPRYENAPNADMLHYTPLKMTDEEFAELKNMLAG